MERDVIDIITEKEFHQLTKDELTQVSELCSNENEFVQMKQVFGQLANASEGIVTPKTETKASLDELFAQTYPKSSPVWYNSILAVVVPKEKPFYRQPLMQLAAVALLLLLVIPMFNNDLVVPNNKMAKAETPAELTEDIEVNVPEIETEMVEMEEDSEVNNQVTIESDSDTREVIEDEFLSDDVVSQPISTTLIGERFVSSASESPVPASNHPDGIFVGGREPNVSTSISALDSEDLLDLLTTTF
jgi:hypothetical protein